MLENKNVIEHNGKKYPIEFNLNVLAEMEEHYEGGLDEWLSLVENKNLTAIRWGICQAMNEAIDIENETSDTPRPFLTEKQVGRLVTSIGTEATVIQLSGALVDSFEKPDPNE